jgi:hypothetical protein
MLDVILEERGCCCACVCYNNSGGHINPIAPLSVNRRKIRIQWQSNFNGCPSAFQNKCLVPSLHSTAKGAVAKVHSNRKAGVVSFNCSQHILMEASDGWERDQGQRDSGRRWMAESSVMSRTAVTLQRCPAAFGKCRHHTRLVPLVVLSSTANVPHSDLKSKGIPGDTTLKTSQVRTRALSEAPCYVLAKASTTQ